MEQENFTQNVPSAVGTQEQTATAMSAPQAKSPVKEDKQPTSKQPFRRGISNETIGTSRLKFSHKDAKQNGLFLGHLDSVDVSMMKVGEDKTGMPSFTGQEVPKLTFRFCSNEDDVNARKWVNIQFNAVESNVNTIPGGKEEWKVNLVFNWLKHILNVFVLKGRPMNDAEINALSLNFMDFDDNGNYINLDPKIILEGWKQLFENFANIMNTGRDGNPVYNDLNGKPIALWMKLIRYTKTRNKGWTPVSNGDLAFPQFVGEGCIEIFKANTIPVIRIDVNRETILPMKIEKAKAPTPMPSPAMGNSMIGGIELPVMPADVPSMGSETSAFMGDDEDMPF